MNKWQATKLLMLGIVYLATGLALMLGILVALGPLMEALIKSYPDEAMPFWISLIPFLVTFVGVGWGAFFMWKALKGPAPAILFYLIGKAGYRILGLHHITTRQRKGIVPVKGMGNE